MVLQKSAQKLAELDAAEAAQTVDAAAARLDRWVARPSTRRPDDGCRAPSRWQERSSAALDHQHEARLEAAKPAPQRPARCRSEVELAEFNAQVEQERAAAPAAALRRRERRRELLCTVLLLCIAMLFAAGTSAALYGMWEEMTKPCSSWHAVHRWVRACHNASWGCAPPASNPAPHTRPVSTQLTRAHSSLTCARTPHRSHARSRPHRHDGGRGGGRLRARNLNRPHASSSLPLS
jgi:hypothetical protein